MKTYYLQVKEIFLETMDTISIQFWHPNNEEIKYKPGQFISLNVPAGEEGTVERRSYSMSSSPYTDSFLTITIKRVPGGKVSNYLFEKVKIGDFLEVIEPMGNFYIEPNKNHEKHYVLVAAGSGITPLMSILKTVLKVEPKSKVTLLYGNRTKESIIFYEALNQLEIDNKERLKVIHFLTQYDDTWVGEKGRINNASGTILLKELGVNFNNEEFYLCGPEAMMEDFGKIFSVYNIPEKLIHKEKFHAYVSEEELEQQDSRKEYTVRVLYDNEEFEFPVKPHETILEAALNLNIELPYSCQAGMCTACLGKCTSGEVVLDEEDGLTKKELSEGYVLTCVAHPTTKNVIIEID